VSLSILETPPVLTHRLAGDWRLMLVIAAIGLVLFSDFAGGAGGAVAADVQFPAQP